MAKAAMNGEPRVPLPPLVSLLEALDLLIAQAQAYERILPANNYPARAAVAVLGELARKALSEAQTIGEILDPQPDGEHPFTPREKQVLELAARGLTNKEIARRLRISDRTVQFHLNSIFNKTATFSRTEAAALAVQKRWIVPS
jgi:DNA-binding NarL/FixJ family response regulator